MNILIKNVRIANVGSVHSEADSIFISDGRISFIGNSGDEIQGHKVDKVIEGRNLIALPGLVNSHTHCAMTLFRNYANDLALEEWLFNKIFPVERKLSSDDVYWGTMLGIAEMIKSGTTCFADMYLHMDAVAHAVYETGIRANLSRSPLRFETGTKVKAFDESEDFIKYFIDWHDSANGRIKVYLEVHSVYLFNEQQLVDAAALAKQLGIGIHIHILETTREREVSISRYGMSSVEICHKCGIFDVPVIAAHCVHLSETDMQILKEKEVNIAHNPSSNLKLGSGIAKINDMLNRGMNVVIGTDGAASNNNLDMFEEMHITALIHKGYLMNPLVLDANTVLGLATSNGAKALGFNETGYIREGMKADLILVDVNKPHLCPLNDPVAALVYSARSSDVDTVIVDGRVLMEKRELKTIDEERVMYEAKRTAEKLLKDL